MINKQHVPKCKINDINMLSGGIVLKRECDCDGYHTFDELYEHRITLYVTICRMLTYDSGCDVWRSKVHSDGSIFDGWFILGIHHKVGEQITYHLPLSRWEECGFADTLEKAPEYDGHSSDDVLTRLQQL